MDNMITLYSIFVPNGAEELPKQRRLPINSIGGVNGEAVYILRQVYDAHGVAKVTASQLGKEGIAVPDGKMMVFAKEKDAAQFYLEVLQYRLDMLHSKQMSIKTEVNSLYKRAKQLGELAEQLARISARVKDEMAAVMFNTPKS